MLELHLIVLSSYIRNWQSYISVLNTDFEEIVSGQLPPAAFSCVNINIKLIPYSQARLVLTIEWSQPKDFEDGQEQLQRLHYLQNQVFIVSPRLKATLHVIETLEALERITNLMRAESEPKGVYHRRQFIYELEMYKSMINGVLESARSVERRMEGILTMLTATLNLGHQATGVDISGGVLRLTTEIVSDSTTVRVITFVTLLYMPATFIATVLGTNLFTYSTSNSHTGFHVSPQFWVFIVLAVPLTLLTIGCWFFYSQRTKRSRVKGLKNQKLSTLWGNGANWLKGTINLGLDTRRRLAKSSGTRSTELEIFAVP
ncbi:MAG: hypothetical protein Q9170_005269 [Blastenia crenularia]